MASFTNVFATFSIVFLFFACSTHAQLSTTFYASSCPTLETVVRTVTNAAVLTDPRMGASLIRLIFHDCFVTGCDASVLLDDTATFRGEKNALANQNSARGFEVIDAIKTAVEATCRATVSCADILALAARDGVFLLGGPTWTVPLGRRDARTASLEAANREIPSPFANLDNLISSFSAKGLNERDLVALSGAHTVGLAQCATFRDRIYNDTNIDPTFATLRRITCPTTGGDTNMAPLDIGSPILFDNNYFQNLVARRGLLHSDQELFNNGMLDSLVRSYANNNALFLSDFAVAMIKINAINPLTGTNGEIRLNCRRIN